jgi:predicted transcriptional regulator
MSAKAMMRSWFLLATHLNAVHKLVWSPTNTKVRQLTIPVDKRQRMCQKFGMSLMKRKRGAGKNPPELDLSRRERQIMNAIYSLKKATAAEIREEMPLPPSYTAVRTLLTILEKRGYLKHSSEQNRYVYEPVVPREEMASAAVNGLLQTFFDNSVERVVATLLSGKDRQISREELDRLAEMIKHAREDGR